MKIAIIGLGSIGKNILKSLSGEGHTITIIDENKDKIETLIEQYDVFGVVGNGACMDIQKEANMDDADLAMAMTNSDELNVFACLVAKKIGVKNTTISSKKPITSSGDQLQLTPAIKRNETTDNTHETEI
jgi:trk system potassium uptake protein TrkA